MFYSLAGIPPFIGFFSKLFILYGLVQIEMYFIVVLLILISVISVFYYIRFIKILFFEKKAVYLSNLKYQIIFSDSYIEIDITNVVIGLFLLLYIFFYPNFLLLISQLFVLGNLSV